MQKKYNLEFKIEAVKLCETSNKSLKQVAIGLGIPSSTLNGWVKDYQKHGENMLATMCEPFYTMLEYKECPTNWRWRDTFTTFEWLNMAMNILI